MSVVTAGAGEAPAEVLRRFEARRPSMSAAESLRVAGEGSRGLSRPRASLGPTRPRDAEKSREIGGE